MATVAGSLRNKVLVLDNVTTGDLTVTGNVTIAGSATTINSTNTSINDHLIELNAGLTGTNPNDLGLILERGSSGNNVFIGWDESADKVVLGLTTGDGASTGNLSLTYADVKAGDITAGRFIQEGSVSNPLYAADFSRSSSGLTTPDIWGSSGTLVLGTSSSDERLALSTAGALIYGRALVRQAAADQNTNADSASIPDTGQAEIMRFEGTYTNGTYTTEFTKLDRSGNLPLYVRQSKGTANAFSNIARFGDHGQTDGGDVFAVFGGAKVTGTISTGAHGTSANWNTAYGWGDHANGGYLTSVPNHSAALITSGTIADARLPTDISSNVTGYANVLKSADNRTISPSEDTAGRLRFGFTSFENNNTAPYADFLHMRSYTDSSGGNDNLLMFKKGGREIRLWQLGFGSSTAYSAYSNVMLDRNNLGTITGGTSQDFNSYDVTGTSYVSNWTGGTGTANGPSHEGNAYGWGMLRVTQFIDANYVVQEYIPHNDDGTFIRVRWNSTWGAWRQSWTSRSDGASSGLDADKLDGQQGSYYLDYGNFTNTPTIPNVSSYLPLAGGTMTGELNIHKTNSAGILNLRNTSDSGSNPVAITFSSQGTSGTQVGHIKYTHSNALSYGALESLTFGGTESSTVILADGQFYYKDGIYKKPSSGTAAGTRKDTNWDTAYTYSQVGHLPLAGGTLTGTVTSRDIMIASGYHLQRSEAHSGHLEGSYNNVGGNSTNTNPIYTIGSDYNPASTTLSNMYGIGFSKNSASFMTGDLDAGNNNGWGLYVAADGDARIFLNGTHGIISSTGEHYADGNRVFHDAYHPNADKWTTARTLTLTGDTTGAVSWDGSGNVSLNATVSGSVFKSRGNVNVTTSSGGNNNLPFDDAHTETRVAENGSRSISYTGASATMFTINTGGSASVFQIGAHYNGNDFYMRTRTDSSTWQTWKKLFHDGYHPNADKWTTARSHTVTLTGQVTGTATQSVDGTGNKTWSISTSMNNSSLDDQYVQILPRHNADGDSLIVTSRASITIWDVSGASDAPSSASDGLVLSAGWDSASWGIQQYHDFHSNDLYLRAKNNGSMTSWERVFHDTYHPNADKWTSSRTLTLGGDLSGSVSFDGSAGFTLTATVADDSHNHIISNVDGLQTALDGKLPKAGGELTGSLTIDVDNQAGGALRIEANQTNPDNDFYFAQEIYSTLSGATATTGDREQGGIYMDINSTATGGDTSNEHRAYGMYVDLDSTGDADLVYGVYADATATPTTGTTSNVFGGYFRAEDNGGAGSTTTLYGVQGIAYSDNANADVNSMYGGYFKTFNAADSAAIPVARGVYGEVEITTGSGDIYGNTYVFESQYDNNTSAAPTHTAALYYGNYAGTLPTTALGVYIVDPVPNSFAGSVRTGLGTTGLSAYGFIGDLNTGMYSPANHELGFTTNGGQRLKLTSTGATVTGNITVSGTVDGRDIATDGAKLDGIAANATANTGDITGVTAGTGLTGGGTSGGVTLNVIGGTGITANANDIAVDSTVLRTTNYGTTLNTVYAPVKKGTATLTNSYQTVCTVNGSGLASTVRMSICGTGNSTVIGTILDIVCNHSLDILVTSQSSSYTIVTVKVISNNNEDFAIQLKTNHANDLPVAMEVFALSAEAIAFTSTNPYSGASLEHECKNGGFASSSTGGAAHEFYSNGTKLIAANDNQALHDTDALSISGNVITLKKGNNTTETVTIPAQGDITGVTAGNGLTGGGTSGTPTINVGAGSGITANANDITVDSTVLRTTGEQTKTGNLKVAAYLSADRTYFNSDRSTGYFYNDTSTRTAYTGGDFYIKADTGNTYLYSTNTFLGNSSGDTILFRTNNVTATNWGISTTGAVTAKNYNLDGTGKYYGDSTTYYMSPETQSMYKYGTTTDNASRNGIRFYHAQGPQMTLWYHAASTGVGNIKIFSSNSGVGDVFQFTPTGAFHAKGDITAYSTTTTSDARLKKNVRDLEGSLDKTLKLRGVKFDWIDENKSKDNLGFIAQEVEEVIPEVVKDITNIDGEENKVVNYQAVVPVLVEAIKELKAEIDELREQLKNK